MGKIYIFKSKAERKMFETSVFNVAGFFLSKDSMTHKKLQKLCYYAYAWYLTLYNKQLFKNNIQAWIHGPVDTALYGAYRNAGWQSIPWNSSFQLGNEELEEFLDEVYQSYGDLSGDELEYLTHMEDPWLNARAGIPEYEPSTNSIRDEDIRSYYLKKYEEGQND
jgi:uncharacterized phage-associated protein